MGIHVTETILRRVYKEQESTAVLKEAVAPLNLTLEKYKINENVNEVASFLAEIGHESAQLRFRLENLNYSDVMLRKVFGKYFNTTRAAQQYARKPQMIANRVYANRMGNGNEASGDGWRFRGKGFIQITGKANHMEYAKFLGLPIEATLDKLMTVEGAFDSAGWFWSSRNLDKYDDDADIRAETKIINGGYNGLPDRQKLMDRAIVALTAHT